MSTTCPTCGEAVIRAKAPEGLVALDPARLVYVVSDPLTKKPYTTLAHQGRPESVARGVQWQYMAAHVCAPKKKPAKLRSVK